MCIRDSSYFEYDNENAIERMNYTKMSDGCRVTLKLAQLSDIVEKTLYTSVRGLKGAILSIKKPSDIYDQLLTNSDYVLVDIILQNLKSDSRIFIIGHIGLDTSREKAIDTMHFVTSFKQIVEPILKEENLKRRNAIMPDTILGELKKELPEESKVVAESNQEKTVDLVFNSNIKALKNSCVISDCSAVNKFNLSKISSRPNRLNEEKVEKLESKSIMLPMSRLDFEALTQRNSQTFKTGKELINSSLLAVSYAFKSIMRSTFRRSSSCLCSKAKKSYKVHAFPDFARCVQDYVEGEGRENLHRHNTTCLKTTKNTSKRSIPKHSRKNANVEFSEGKRLESVHNESNLNSSAKLNNLAEESKNYRCLFDTSNGSVTRHYISILSFLNKQDDQASHHVPKAPTQSEVISPMPSQLKHCEHRARVLSSSQLSDRLSRIRHKSFAINESQATNQI
eukprot:TRINITY_DN2364_c0_g2_i3.p1 TRINITY_DN2364_c0_g2~~TRINITY_DN2364_c0_g2_i3.p1  ORF type:complete len:452 (-),score=102.31 TRINITY_DN2364_c0_g2_i3:140-1495(-)